ncbi:ATP-binding cassette domain-containing protein [Nonomuraea jiangxiensis]|uniref:ATPase components of ABC transporters with duplicated ATPase domains n=1 Tax=Nonomuraea jiangxiensis TaxID=633440 RepID=A0A1G8WDM1_9ACTN|nr:ATP-binding cassette domain-containing protein [Nonomuraea jiangxiensis]SDJ76237.1 ATPase components of ABC transporters with duplicated ATPase domains [Nonomuraea jiangxiensis]
MGHIEVSGLTYLLPDGRPLLLEASFKIADGAKAALVGPNGAGKTTLLRLIAGELHPSDGRIASSGGIGVMRQFTGPGTVHDLLLGVAPQRVRQAAAALEAAEAALARADDEPAQLAYAQALADYSDAGGYELEVVWDVCATEALGLPYERVKDRDLATLSGGEQKRLVLAALLRGPDEILLLDEPDNFLDVPAKQWLERAIRGSAKTVLLVSHDRRLLAEAADRIVTVEGRGVWVHGGGFAGYAEARRRRGERLEELRRRWEDERGKLRRLVHTLRQRSAHNDALAGAYRSAVTRLERFERAGPPERAPKEQNVRMRLRGGRTGKRAVVCEELELTGLLRPFSTEIWYGERVGVLGLNGTGKTHFLRLLAGEPVAHRGVARLGARVVPGHFAQTHLRPDLHGRAAVDVVMREHAMTRNEAMAALARYELAAAGGQPFETLSGGQQARLQILLLELSGATLLLLDEPTDNLDLASAEALQQGLAGFEGTVLAVTHDRWFADDLDRHLIFGADGTVREHDDPRWDL